MILRGGTVIDVDGTRVCDVRVGSDGRIRQTAEGVGVLDGEQVVECAGLLVVPGGVDAHTHFHLLAGAAVRRSGQRRSHDL